VSGENAEAAASRREQAAMTTAADDDVAAIAAGNAAYEERFGRVFLIRAAGRTPGEIRAELERRLTNDPDAETLEATRQLAEIALLRLRGSVTDAPEGTE
jgi:2-oxo-4-hydroxy-4-carboxy-5-ureidoimidazoline decarboxylase